MKKHFTLALLTGFIFLFSFLKAAAQNNSQSSEATKFEVIQFHSEHRCKTCMKIEEYSKETVTAYPDFIFRMVNIDDKQNDKIVKQFLAFGTSLFLYEPATGKKNDLTDFAFMNAGNKDKFIKELKKHIDEFKKAK